MCNAIRTPPASPRALTGYLMWHLKCMLEDFRPANKQCVWLWLLEELVGGGGEGVEVFHVFEIVDSLLEEPASWEIG